MKKKVKRNKEKERKGKGGERKRVFECVKARESLPSLMRVGLVCGLRVWMAIYMRLRACEVRFLPISTLIRLFFHINFDIHFILG